MWVVLVVVLYREWDHLQHGCGIWSGLDPGVVAFEGFDECFADAVALGASHRGEAGDEAEGLPTPINPASRLRSQGIPASGLHDIVRLTELMAALRA
jgi:hypothetical protein